MRPLAKRLGVYFFAMRKLIINIIVLALAVNIAGQGYLPKAEPGNALRAESAALSDTLDIVELFRVDKALIPHKDKASSAGISIRVDKVVGVFAYASSSDQKAISDILEKGMGSRDPYYNLSSVIGSVAMGNISGDNLQEYTDATLFELRKNLKESKKYDKLLSAMRLVSLGSLDSDIIRKYEKIILPVFKHNLKTEHSLLAAVGLAAIGTIDRDVLLKYEDILAPILEQNLSNDYKLWASIGLAFMCSVDANISLKYKDNIHNVFHVSLADKDQHNRMLAITGFAAVQRKGASLYSVSISYRGIDKPYTILVGGTKELAIRLNRDILIRLGLSCDSVSSTKVLLLGNIDNKLQKKQ